MPQQGLRRIGLLLAGVEPARVGEVAALAEELGFGSVWAPEDYPERPAAVMAALAVAATRTITVATGVTSLTTRHPVLAAMEAATLADAAPGRTVAGVGLGLPVALAPLGCLPDRPVAEVRRRAAAVARLLAGETVDGVHLAHPPAQPPPLAVGGLGPRMLAIAGELADQVVISSLGTERYLRWAVHHVGAVAAEHGRPMPRVSAFAWFHVSDSDADARAVLRPNVAGALGAVGPGPLTDADGWSDTLSSLRSGDTPLVETLPDEWVEEMTIAGTAASCAHGIARRLAAGADEVVLCPMGDDPARQLRLVAEQVAPLLP